MSKSDGRAHSRRTFLGGAGAGAASLWLAACGSGSDTAATSSSVAEPAEQSVNAVDDGKLLVFNWQDYINPDLVKQFEKEHGVKVVYDFFDGMESMVAKITTGGQKYDVVFPVYDTTDRLVKQGLLEPLAFDNIPNRKYIPAEFQDPSYDPGSVHTVPYAIWTSGILYRRDKVGGDLTSWNDLFDERFKGKLGMLDNWQESLGVVHFLNGWDAAATDEAHIQAARDKLIEQKPLVRDYSVDDIGNMSSGDFWVHHGWSGDGYQIKNKVKDPDNIGYVVPKEGSFAGTDTMAIVKGAPHKKTAEEFINFMYDPANSKANIEYIGYPMINSETQDVFPTLEGAEASMAVTSEDLKRLTVPPTLPRADRRVWLKAWAEVKNS
jgi:spermidine/putrescine transport system substrate-binding protein